MFAAGGSLLSARASFFHLVTSSGFPVNVTLALFESTRTQVNRDRQIVLLFVTNNCRSVEALTQGLELSQKYHHTVRWLEVAAGFLDEPSEEMKRLYCLRLRALGVVHAFARELLRQAGEQPQPLVISTAILQSITAHQEEHEINVMEWSRKRARFLPALREELQAFFFDIPVKKEDEDPHQQAMDEAT